MPKISIKAETLFHLGSFQVTNSLFYSLFILAFFIYLAYEYHRQSVSGHYKGLYYLINLVLRLLYNLFESIVHDKIDTFFPLLAAFFIWIIVQNWSGLLPGVGSIMVGIKEPVSHTQTLEEKGEAPSMAEEEKIEQIPLFRGNNADINATLALALVAVAMVQVYGVKFLGFFTYIKKFIDISNPVNFVLGILEIMSEVSKVLSFTFRLFGNIFAGEVLLTIVAFLVPVLASFPFLILEIFVGFVQALVFSMLTSVFFSLAVSSHH